MKKSSKPALSVSYQGRGGKNECKNSALTPLRVRIRPTDSAQTSFEGCLRFAAQTRSAVISSTGIGPRAAHETPSPRYNKMDHWQNTEQREDKWGIMAATTNSTYKRNAASSTSSDDGARATTGSAMRRLD